MAEDVDDDWEALLDAEIQKNEASMPIEAEPEPVIEVKEIRRENIYTFIHHHYLYMRDFHLIPMTFPDADELNL